MSSTPERIPADGSAPVSVDRVDARLVAFSFVDNAGITRVKTVPMHRLSRAARYGVGASPTFDVFSFDDVMNPGRYVTGPDGDLRVVPDLARLTELVCQPGWAW
ncbi:glutamine synthetase, partial [Nocardia gipuzkoensis]